MAGRRAQGSLESKVLAALWAAGSPLTASDAAEALSGDHAAVPAPFLQTLRPEDEATPAALLADRDEALR